MPEHDPVRPLLDELDALREVAPAPQRTARAAAALEHEDARVVARAAELAREHGMDGLAPRMRAAFFRFLDDAARRDPGCRAKLALVDALRVLGHGAEDVFRAGAGHVQVEDPGGVDTAGELRGSSVDALLAGRSPGAWELAAAVLEDPDAGARLGAVEAIERAGNAALGVPLLRAKASRGDDSSEVLSACLRGLLGLDPAGSMEFVVSFLDAAAARVRKAAALALGDSQLASALPPLRAFSQRYPDTRRAGLVAIALLRTRAALQYLFDLVVAAPADVGRDAVAALYSYRREAWLYHRVADALGDRGSRHRSQPEAAGPPPTL